MSLDIAKCPQAVWKGAEFPLVENHWSRIISTEWFSTRGGGRGGSTRQGLAEAVALVSL